VPPVPPVPTVPALPVVSPVPLPPLPTGPCVTVSTGRNETVGCSDDATERLSKFVLKPSHPAKAAVRERDFDGLEVS
jgi:hypothetical protein